MKVLVGEPKEKIFVVWRQRDRWNVNIKMLLRNGKSLEWIQLVQNSVHRLAALNTVIDVCVYFLECEIFLVQMSNCHCLIKYPAQNKLLKIGPYL
jgi:hypothetical protein